MSRETFWKQVWCGWVMAWAIGLTTAGSLLAGEAAGSAATPMVEDTEWEGITAELTSVERTSGDMLTIKFKYTNTSPNKTDVSRIGKFSSDNVVDHVYYIETKSKKKYLVVKDSEGKAVGTNLKFFELAPGQSKAAWAKFPEPPADVQKISVYLPGTPPFEDVPIR